MYGQVKELLNDSALVAWEPYGTLPAQEGWTFQRSIERCPTLDEEDGQGVGVGDQIYHIGYALRGEVRYLPNANTRYIEARLGRSPAETVRWLPRNCVMLQRKSRMC